MALRPQRLSGARSEHPVAAELAVVVAVLAALSLWRHLARDVVVPAAGFAPGGPGFEAVDSLLLAGAVSGGLLLAGTAAITAVYVAVRGLEVGGVRPPRGGVRTVAAAVLAPVALVAATKLVGVLTGTAYGTLLLRSYGAAATAEHVAATTALQLFVAVPTLVVVCQVLIQGSFRRAAGGDAAALMTVLVAGFLLVDPDGGAVNALPDRGKVAGAALFVAAVAVALYGTGRADRPALRYASVLPAALFVAAAVLSAVAAVGTVAGALFVAAKLAVLGVAACGYERSDSLFVPALTYAAFLASGEAVVFLFEAGVRGW